VNRTQGHQAPVRLTATIRPPDSADLVPLGDFFAALSMRTRVQRFFAPIRPTPALVRLACGRPARADGPGPGDRAGHTDALLATHDGVIIGHAMAADRPASRQRPVPPDAPVTEIGVVVADAWQGQGVGSALVRSLISRAQARGVTALSMDVMPGNREVLAMIGSHWTAARTHRAADCVTIHVRLAPGQSARLRSQQPREAPHQHQRHRQGDDHARVDGQFGHGAGQGHLPQRQVRADREDVPGGPR
jgi:GNAT superfamily N-acetyltransferase